MGIPLWREPSDVETSKSTLDKDPSSAARSSIRRQHSVRRSRHPNARARGANVLSSFHSQILDEIQRGAGEPPSGVRSPVMNIGVSEDGLDLDASRREALGRNTTRPSAHRLDISSRRLRNTPLSDLLRDTPPRSHRYSSPSLTPNFAPATAYHSVASPQPPDVPRIRERERERDLPPIRRLYSRDLLETPYPSELLRRHIQSRDRIRDSNRPSESRTPIDGLGDRQRSLSPDGDRETDAWETLLSTITPDANLPSTDSSFSSNSASANGTTSRPAGTTTTSLPPVHMVPSHVTLEPYPDHLNPCDFSSDDEDNAANYHQYTGPSSIGRPSAHSLDHVSLYHPPTQSSRRTLPDLHSTLSSHPPVPYISLSFGSLDSDDNDTPNIDQMQAILDRLVRREDIPDDWWAGAGLSQNMRRGLNATAPRPNENGNTD